MNDTQTASCSSCGRQPWPGERFCSACGSELSGGGQQPSTSYIELTATDAPTEVARRGRRRVREVIAALVGVLLLVGLGFAVASGGPDDSVDDNTVDAAASPSDGEGFTAADEPADTADADTADTNTADDPAATPTARPTSAPERSGAEPAAPDATPEEVDFGEGGASDVVGSALGPGDALVDLNLGPGWLGTVAGSMATLWNTETGERFEAPIEQLGMNQSQFAGVLNRYGTISSDRSELTFTPWDGSDPVTFERTEAQISLVYPDPTVGPVMVTTVYPDFEPDGAQTSVKFTAHALLSGERREVEIDPIAGLLGQRFGGFSFTGVELPTMLVAVNGEVWKWTWADGWEVVGAGDAVYPTTHGLFVNACASPTDCQLELHPGDGRAIPVGDANILTGEPSVSPDATWIGTFRLGARSPGSSDVVFTEIATGETWTVDGDGVSTVQWVNDDVALIGTGGSEPHAYRISSREIFELDFLVPDEFTFDAFTLREMVSVAEFSASQ